MTDIHIPLSEASGVPYYRQITDQIADQIRAGTLDSGRRLPSVRELALTLRVSLITVRRAYTELESANLIVRRQGKGTFVADNVGAAAKQRALSDARVVLAAAVARALRLGLTPVQVIALVQDSLNTEDGNNA